MDLEGVVLREISQAAQDKYHVVSLDVESEKQNKRTNKKQEQTRKYRERASCCQKGGDRQTGTQVKGSKRYKRPAIK